MRGKIWGYGVAFFTLYTGGAFAIEETPYETMWGFTDRLTLMMRQLAEEAEMYDEDVETSQIFQDLITHENKYNESRPLTDEVQLTTYSVNPAPQVILRWKGYRSVESPFLEMDTYFRALKKRGSLSHFNHKRLAKLWSQAVIRMLLPLLKPKQTPWIIEITDEQKIKKGTSPYPTRVVGDLVLRITTPEGKKFRFDRKFRHQSTLALASLIYETVRDAQSFNQRDSHWLNLLPGKYSESARAVRFLEDQNQIKRGLTILSGKICKDLLNSARKSNDQ